MNIGLLWLTRASTCRFENPTGYIRKGSIFAALSRVRGLEGGDVELIIFSSCSCMSSSTVSLIFCFPAKTAKGLSRDDVWDSDRLAACHTRGPEARMPLFLSARALEAFASRFLRALVSWVWQRALWRMFLSSGSTKRSGRGRGLEFVPLLASIRFAHRIRPAI